MVASLRIGTQSSYYTRAYYEGGEIDLAAVWYAPGAGSESSTAERSMPRSSSASMLASIPKAALS